MSLPGMGSSPAPLAWAVGVWGLALWVPHPCVGQTAGTPAWHRVLSTQRIGGRLTALAVDPNDPRRIFVGTEEGTLLRSLDGGVTWLDFEITPFVVQDRTVGVLPPPKPDATAGGGEYFRFFYDPYHTKYLERLEIPFDTLFFSLHPDFVAAGFFPTTPEYRWSFLNDSVASRRATTTPVTRVVLCPGSRYPLLLTTARALYGSDDEGVTFTNLYQVLSPAVVYQVACDPRHPNEVILGTDFGGFHSTDGGLTFDTLIMGRGEMTVTAAAYVETQNADPRVFVAADDYAYAGDPRDRKEGLTYVYPNYDNAETAPWKRINWVALTKSGQAWLATDDGLRASRGATYTNWDNVEPGLFNRAHIKQVVVGENESGGERIAMMSEDWVYASDDYGKTWFPYFYGVSRRVNKQLAVTPSGPNGPPRFWVLTAGGLYSSRPHEPAGKLANTPLARWARAELNRAKPLGRAITDVLDASGLSSNKIHDAIDTLKARSYIPRVDASVTVGRRRSLSLGRTTGTEFVEVWDGFAENQWSVFVQATWDFRDLHIIDEDYDDNRVLLYQLKKQVSFIIEDAWSERRSTLERLAQGVDDPLQALILEERVKTLDCVLDVWSRN